MAGRLSRRRLLGLVGALLCAVCLVIALNLRRDRENSTSIERPPLGPSFRVVDPGGRPMADCRVDFFLRSPYRRDLILVDRRTTDADGRAPIVASDLLPDEEELVALIRAEAAGGHAGEAFLIDEWEKDLQLSEGSEAHGRVVDLNGRPVAGARVTSPEQPPFVIVTTTDEEGRFRLGPLGEDAWLRAEAEGYAPLDLSRVLYPQEDPEIVFYLVEERRVSGRVVDSSGNGLSKVVVTLDQETRSRFLTDGDGNFELRGVLPDWEVLFTARAEGRVDACGTAVADQTGFLLTLNRPAEIQGTVVDGRTEAPIAEFSFRRQKAERMGENGFRIADLLPGKLSLTVRSGSLMGRADLDLAEGQVRRGLRIPLFPPQWGDRRDLREPNDVRFKVVDEETGQTLPGVRVRGASAGQEARTDELGIVELLFTPGTHRLMFGGSFEPYARKTVEVEVSEDSEREVRLSGNTEAVLELREGRVVRDSKLWLHGRGDVVEVEFPGRTYSFHAPKGEPFDFALKAKGHHPVIRRTVTLPDDGRIPVLLYEGPMIRGRCMGAGGFPLPKVVAEVEEHPLDARMETLGDGRFSVGPLRPGTYSLLLYARNVRSRRIEVDVASDGADLGDVPMPPPGRIDVLVLTSDRRPVAGAVVETSLLVAAKALTDADGFVSLPGKNLTETLHVLAEGFLEGWKDVDYPDETAAAEVTVTLHRPASLMVRTVDRSGRLVDALPPDGEYVQRLGVGEFRVGLLPPGPLDLEFRDRQGRSGRLQVLVREGEERVESVILE